MTKLIKNFIHGAGSVVNIAPHRPNRAAVSGKFYTSKNDEHSISKDWCKVGQHLKNATNTALKSNDKKSR